MPQLGEAEIEAGYPSRREVTSSCVQGRMQKSAGRERRDGKEMTMPSPAIELQTAIHSPGAGEATLGLEARCSAGPRIYDATPPNVSLSLYQLWPHQHVRLVARAPRSASEQLVHDPHLVEARGARARRSRSWSGCSRTALGETRMVAGFGIALVNLRHASSARRATTMTCWCIMGCCGIGR
jgi:hypothetical protein